MHNLLVMKFGGTSMGSADRIRAAAALSREQMALRPTVVVVSAMSKITDLLLDTLRAAEHGDQQAMETNLTALAGRHLATLHDLLPAGGTAAETEREITALLASFLQFANAQLCVHLQKSKSKQLVGFYRVKI